MKTDTCRFCWWQEGGRCYEESFDFKRDKHGRSDKLADGKCDKYTNKRAFLSQFIPTEMLVITSEENTFPIVKDKN